MRIKFVQKIIDIIRGKNRTLKYSWEYLRDKKPTEVYIIKDFGGDFKQYIFENSMPKIINKLKKNFDEESIEIIDRKVGEFLNVPNKGFNNNQICGIGYKSFLDQEELLEQENWFK